MIRSKLHVKKDDEVKVITGDSKGVVGKVVSVNRSNQTVLVEGARAYKKSVKPTQENTAGGWQDKPRAIHVSNVKLVSELAAVKSVPTTAKKAAKKTTKKVASKKAAKEV